MKQSNRMATGLLLVAVLAAAVPAGAQDEEPPAGALAPGPWFASGDASGTATVTAQGATITWTGDVPAQFEFAISEQGEGQPGVAAGVWEHQGGAEMIISVDQGAAVADLTFSGGGQLRGSDRRLELTGSSTTTGEVKVGLGSFPVNNTSQVPPLTVNVGAVTCDEAYGDWEFTIEQAFEDEGFTASFTGFWIGLRLSGFVQDEISVIMEAFEASPDGTVSDIESRSELVGLSSAMRSEYNAFVDAYPDGWTTEVVIGMAARTEELLNQWRNLSECLARLFGEGNVETFVNGLTLVIQGLITGAASTADSTTWQQLAHLGIRTGAFGPGASNPAAAVTAEQALIDAGEAVLEAHVDPEDGGIFVTLDTNRVMATGALMGWSYSVNGQFIDARATYESFFSGGEEG